MNNRTMPSMSANLSDDTEREFYTSLNTPFPEIELIENDYEFIIRALLPGVDKKDIDISLTNNSVTINAYASRMDNRQEENFPRHDTERGIFTRCIVLSAAVEGAKAKATYKYGILELVFPKDQSIIRRTIAVE